MSDARTDRLALERLLADKGLRDHAGRLAHRVAEWSLKLEEARADVGSRLGGPPLLAPDTSWPRARTGQPLSFVAALDLSELPAWTPLPAAGWLLFFAVLDPDVGVTIEPVSTGPGDQARVLFVPLGADPVPASPPEDLTMILEGRRITFTERLTLPDDYEAAQRLGLDAARTQRYQDLTGFLRYGPDGWGLDKRDHWVLGAATGAQGHPVADDDTVLLLHIGWDEDLRFWFLDDGTLQFRIPAAALAAGDWTQVEADPSSC